jgi:hypothetical protein
MSLPPNLPYRKRLREEPTPSPPAASLPQPRGEAEAEQSYQDALTTAQLVPTVIGDAANMFEAAASMSSSAALSSSSSSPPPAHLRLYRHALESMFSFCSLPELHHISSVCRQWSAAVLSMKPISGWIKTVMSAGEAATVRCLEDSRLARRHVNAVGEHLSHEIPLSGVLVTRLLQALPRIQILSWVLPALGQVGDSLPMLFSPSLTELHVTIRLCIPDTLRYFRQLNQLKLLSVTIEDECMSTISFAPLQQLPSLRHFGLHLYDDMYADRELSEVQMAEVMLLTQLEILNLPFDGKWLPQLLLKPDHHLAWTDVCWISLENDHQLTGLVTLTGLGTLELCTKHYVIADFDFLSAFRSLTSLSLHLWRYDGQQPTSMALLAGARHCARLTSLLLDDITWSASDLQRFLSFCPLMSSLILDDCAQIRSLSWLASPALQQRLKSLWIQNCRSDIRDLLIPNTPHERSFLSTLRASDYVFLNHCFHPVLTADHIRSIQASLPAQSRLNVEPKPVEP